ncbi:DUF4245 domain-containing protein [Nocardiopsis sp. HNM0947]|uniref:DUF4245 domain-containing protein n=1 Tax=Nocardiopsis coralli TaxID=2772213 RepID=A0ABR9P8M8_9ACTN|nr:DUF4245 domain-containing protein [Nocardiopsis coralli]MBE3000201.1 DUF4245 domain-containing protein [Nocardiopsis coralli]
MSEYTRSSATFKNYAISLGIIVGILLLMYVVVATRSEEHIPTVEYGPDAETLQSEADYPVTLPPEDLPEGWTATSSHLDIGEPVEWSLGFATPQDSHVMITQSDDDPEIVFDDRVRDAEPVGTVNAGDREWDHYDNEDDWRALVSEEDGHILVVSGPADLDELAYMAEGLRDAPEDGEGNGGAGSEGEGSDGAEGEPGDDPSDA